MTEQKDTELTEQRTPEATEDSVGVVWFARELMCSITAGKPSRKTALKLRACGEYEAARRDSVATAFAPA